MKNFWNVGKWTAVALVGAALLFAGCMPQHSSEDSAIPAKGGGGGGGGSGPRFVYKFNVDPQGGKVTIQPVVMGTATQTGQYGYTVDVTTANIINAVVFTDAGSGLDDLTASGAPSGNEAFRVVIDQLADGATIETFKWSKDGGATWAATLVPITTGYQPLMDRVSVKFANPSGHFLGDRWDFTTTNGCSWIGNPTNTLNCSIRVMNQSANYYMTNMRTWTYRASGAGAATLATADYPNTITGSTWTQPAPKPFTDAAKMGMCYVRDGVWNTQATNDLKAQGCPTYMISAGLQNQQILHPDCGSLAQNWTFTNATTAYSFYTALVLAGATATQVGNTLGNDPQWFPEDVRNDTRMDFTNLSTILAMPYNLDYNCTLWPGGCDDTQALEACISVNNSNSDGWAIGSAYCSTPLNVHQKLAAGTYFAVNMGVNFADRIETTQNHATKQNSIAVPNACFEWPASVQAMMTWDPSVLTIVTNNTTTALGTHLPLSASRLLFDGNKTGNDVRAANYMDTNTGFESLIVGVLSNQGFFTASRSIPALTSFTFATPGAGCIPSVENSTGRNWTMGLPNNQLGWTGLAHFINSAGNCDIVDGGTKIVSDGGPQDQVNYWFAMIYMKVLASAPSGLGSNLKIESSVDTSYVGWFNSNCTRNGGDNNTDGDIFGWCYPCTNSASTMTLTHTLAPTVKNGGGDTDTTIDTTNGIPFDLAYDESTFGTDVGNLHVRGNAAVHEKMVVSGFDTSSIPAGSTINSVLLRVRCGRSGAFTGAVPVVNYSTVSGVWTATALTCNTGTAAGNYKPEGTLALGALTLTQLSNLAVRYINTPTTQVAMLFSGFDYVWVDVNYTTPSGSGPCTATPSGSGGVDCSTSYVPPENDPKFYVYATQEVFNKDVLQGGPHALRGRGLQTQNAYICVQ